MKILHLDTNHELLINQLNDLGFKNDEDYKLGTDEVKLTIINVELAIDGKHDPTASMTFTDPAYQKCTFWLNDDIDVISGGEEDDANTGTLY